MVISDKLLKSAEQYFAAHEQDMISDLCRLVEVESVSCPNDDPEAPYGEGCKKVLSVMEQICAEHGYSFINHENRCGSVRCGEGSGELGVFSHLDVVPAGSGWMSAPFSPVVENGYLRGRGAIDNKGSAIIGLYALDCIRALGIPLKHAVRLFYGLNEEDMMTCVEYYGTKNPWPEFTLVPDSMFPAAFAEKGIFAGTVRSKKIAKAVRSLKGGLATNMVAGECEIAIAAKYFAQTKLFESDRVTVTLEKNKTVIRSRGLSAHASMPEQSLNAIALAFDVLICSGALQGEELDVISFWRNALLDVKGRTLLIDNDAGEYGMLTIIGGLASLEDGCFNFGFNCRYPAKDSVKRILPLLEKACARHGLTVSVQEAVDGFCLSPDHPVVTAMTDIANELTGERRKPFLMKGATFCRVVPNAIPFGPEMDNTAPDFPTGHGGIHQPDEALNLKEMLSAAKIYVAALTELDSML